MRKLTLTLSASIPQNGLTHSNNSSANCDELFETIWPFCEIGAKRVKVIEQKNVIVTLWQWRMSIASYNYLKTKFVKVRNKTISNVIKLFNPVLFQLVCERSRLIYKDVQLKKNWRVGCLSLAWAAMEIKFSSDFVSNLVNLEKHNLH